jgi:hypothetical protein
MTGKEIATKSKIYLKEYKNNLVTTINQNERIYGFNDIGSKQELKEVVDILCDYNKLEKELDELTKYKRAFEILKDKGVCVRNDRLYFDYEIYIKSTKEERELLEELMKGE